MDFDQDTSLYELSSSGSTDIFICKMDENGNLIWVKQNEGSGPDDCYSITTDNNQNIILTGRFHSTVDFDPGSGTQYATNTPEVGGMTFIQKLDSNGIFQWVNTMGGDGIDAGEEIVSDANGNIYTIGRFESTIDFDPGLGVCNKTSNGAQDIFIQKLDSNGVLVWVQ